MRRAPDGGEREAALMRGALATSTFGDKSAARACGPAPNHLAHVPLRR